jgi:hypothetical protein
MGCAIRPATWRRCVHQSNIACSDPASACMVECRKKVSAWQASALQPLSENKKVLSSLYISLCFEQIYNIICVKFLENVADLLYLETAVAYESDIHHEITFSKLPSCFFYSRRSFALSL